MTRAEERGAFTAAEAARYLGIGEHQMLQLLREREIPAIRLGRRWIVSRKALDRWLETRSEQYAEIELGR